MTKTHIKTENGKAYFAESAMVTLVKCKKCGEEMIPTGHYDDTFPGKREAFWRNGYCKECEAAYEKYCDICKEYQKYPESFVMSFWKSIYDSDNEDYTEALICEKCWNDKTGEVLHLLLDYESHTVIDRPSHTPPPETTANGTAERGTHENTQ